MTLIKNQNQIDKIRTAGKVVALILKEVSEIVKPGVNLLELEAKAKEVFTREGAESGTLGYDGFPSWICLSINEEMVHGIARDIVLQEGDLVSIDVVALKDGYYADACVTVPVGTIEPLANKLNEVTKEALYSAIKFAKPGITLGQLGAHIEQFAINNGFTAAREYVGHGIGESMHEDPYVPNYAFEGGLVLQEGMVICIEPMFVNGKPKLFTDPIDNWTVRTIHGGLTSHHEHTVLITNEGGKPLTK